MEEFREYSEGKIIKIYCSECGVKYKEIRIDVFKAEIEEDRTILRYVSEC